MSYQENKTITSIVSGIILMSVYAVKAWEKFQSGAAPADAGHVWAAMMLKFIAIGIGITIALQILFHILYSVVVAAREKIKDENCGDEVIEKTIKLEMVEDERDKLIELKSLRAGFILAGIGFVGSLIHLALGYPVAVMLNILFFSFFAGSILEGAVQLYYYRRGV
jgi:hypothetical protein